MSEKPWRDEKALRELYIEREMSTFEIADELECCQHTVWRWLQKHGIETRGRGHSIEHMNAHVSDSGYVEWRSHNESCYVHQLLAIASGVDPYIVFDDEYVIHHPNEVPWDNRRENLEAVTHAEHQRKHSKYQRPSCDELVRLYHERELTQKEIAERVGCSSSAVGKWMKEYGISTRGSSAYPLGGDD